MPTAFDTESFLRSPAGAAADGPRDLEAVFAALRETAETLRQDLERRAPAAPAPVAVKLDPQLQALYDSLREILEEQQKVHAKAVRAEVDRILYLLAGCAGLTMGVAFWTILKP
ncbi:MAG: hypothetical protein SFV18_17840 [Bryobacteraceae bacterium]|jgi:hypothetical protein|nr:hypothetical protein [Bryobacteraceae bacterium]